MNIDTSKIKWHSCGFPKYPGLYVGIVNGDECMVWYTGHRFINFFTKETINVSKWGKAKERFEDIALYNIHRFM